MRAVRKINTIVSIVKRYNRCINRCRNYLKRGIYRINPSLTVIYNSSEAVEGGNIQKYLFGNQREKNSLLKLLTKFLFRYIRNDGEVFAGQLVTISTNENAYKVFDYTSSKLLTIFDSAALLKDIYSKRQIWGEYFPVIKSDVFDEYILREEILICKSFNHIDMFFSVIDDYILFLEKTSYSNAYITEDDLSLFNSFQNDFGMINGYDREHLVGKCVKKCITHGDLWSSNIISNNDKHYYIDFENVGTRVFYFDVMMYMFSEELILDDSHLLSSYFDGKYDCIMERLFNAAGDVFYKESRGLYFFIFLYSLYIDRWKGNQSAETTINVKDIFMKYLG